MALLGRKTLFVRMELRLEEGLQGLHLSPELSNFLGGGIIHINFIFYEVSMSLIDNFKT